MNTTKALAAEMIILMFVAAPAGARNSVETQRAQKKSAVGSADGRQTRLAQPVGAEPEYVIGPEDVVEINVWEEPRFSRTVPVRPDGKISLPLLNDIQAAGLTAMQLSASITEMLRKYVTQPQVTTTVAAINSRRVYILGEVNHPGPVVLLPNMTVLQALASAGGFSQFANPKGIYILRNENGKRNIYPFNYKRAIRSVAMDQNILLKPADTIVVP